jgi:shikimate kinase
VVTKVSSFDNLVIATGGGVVLESANVAALKNNGIIILLRCSPEVILKRVDAAGSRPLLAGAKDLKGRIKELLAQREAAYARAADFDVYVEDEDQETVAVRIIKLLEEKE